MPGKKPPRATNNRSARRMIDRRSLLYSMLLTVPVTACSKPPQPMELTVYKSPNCKWSSAWVNHLEAGGINVRVRQIKSMADKAKDLSVPDKFRSCQTAEIDGYFVEGQVPAADIRRLLDERPDALGLAVPGMPRAGTNMDQVERRETFNTIIVDRTGAARIFHRHNLQAARSP